MVSNSSSLLMSISISIFIFININVTNMKRHMLIWLFISILMGKGKEQGRLAKKRGHNYQPINHVESNLKMITEFYICFV
jgi:hypothetical protein